MSILSPRDAESLLASGLLSSPDMDGNRRIHIRRLNRSSDEEYSDVPLDPISTTTSTMFRTIPENLISLATLRYLGFNEETATYIWHRWTNWPPGPIVRETDDDRGADFVMTFIDFATDHVTAKRELDAFEDRNLDWFNFMDECGICPELVNHIMDPVFKDIRLTQSCLFWVKDTMELRYRGLQEVQKASHERAMSLGQETSRSDELGSREGATSSRGGFGSARAT
ncbi:uncharacterized protein F4807DRAFT_468115 [Annulohypoxylon truncatum]|uniref:uncharacterized protein n=1 Tax=Annulohypoxylon truncatum TaxID=327061 RepID=UPI0020079475|nr:uncharacterized protein F4807DRAFT_468115 [Annulohypoxylon truncatum]KAI1214165.1 hypothetical protein F4807DRAFT_468115 [Annulohypoxylon truncatum]